MLKDRALYVYYGARERDDLCDASVLGEDAASAARFVAVLSEGGADWSGPAGFLHDVAAAEMGAGLADCEIYFAGPTAMSAAVQKTAHEAGVPQDQLHFDEFY